MGSPFFSIVIPTYNRADRIAKTISSVIDQTFDDFEIIVVDDGSTDHTAEVVRGIADTRLFYAKTQNKERAAARNTGTLQAKGVYVTFLDSDDLFYKDHLETAYRNLSGERQEVYQQAYEVITDNGTVLYRMGEDKPFLNELLFTRGNVMSCVGVFLRRDIASANLFHEARGLSGVEDWELWLRVAALYPIHHGNKITAALVQHQGRSVSESGNQRWTRRMEMFLDLVEANQPIREKYGSLMPRLRSNVATYLSLHLSESKGNAWRAFSFLLSGIRHYPGALIQRRTLAILRNLLVG